jgi:hypothetical protein
MRADSIDSSILRWGVAVADRKEDVMICTLRVGDVALWIVRRASGRLESRRALLAKPTSSPAMGSE